MNARRTSQREKTCSFPTNRTPISRKRTKHQGKFAGQEESARDTYEEDDQYEDDLDYEGWFVTWRIQKSFRRLTRMLWRMILDEYAVDEDEVIEEYLEDYYGENKKKNQKGKIAKTNKSGET